MCGEGDDNGVSAALRLSREVSDFSSAIRETYKSTVPDVSAIMLRRRNIVRAVAIFFFLENSARQFGAIGRVYETRSRRRTDTVTRGRYGRYPRAN